MATLMDYVDGIRRQRAAHGLPMQPGATDLQLETLCRRARDELDVDLPDSYLNLLRVVNGFDENSLWLFATHLSLDLSTADTEVKLMIPGFVEENVALRGVPELADYFVVASGGQYFHAYSRDLRSYVALPQEGGSFVGDFDTFDELMISAIDRILRPRFKPGA